MTNKKSFDKKNAEDRKSRTAKTLFLVGSILVAMLLWIYAIGYDSTLFESTYDGVEVILEGEDALAELHGYTLADNQKFSSITIVAKGKRSDLNALKPSDFRAVVDVSQVTGAGDQTLNIVVYSPNGIEVVSQSSSTVSVFVDEFTQRKELLSVSVDTGKNYIMSEGVTFVSAVANPISVTVSGPSSLLDRIEGAYVRFNLDGYEIKENVYGYGAIELRDKDGNVIDNPYLTVSDANAYVSITVTKQKTVPVRVNFIGGVFNPSDVSCELSTQSIVVSGSPDALSGIDEIVLPIDETTIDGSADFDFVVGALLPDGLQNESGASKISVRVTLPKLSVREYAIPADKIVLKNIPEEVTFVPKNGVSVTVVGARDAISKLDPSTITASVDFDRITVETDGSYTGTVECTVTNPPEGLYILNEGTTLNFSFAE